MTQEKIDYSKILPQDAISQISIYQDGEKSRSNLALASTMFGFGEAQKTRIIAKLSDYLAAGHIDTAVKLLSLRPDLSKVIKNFLGQALFRLVGFGEQDKVEIILKLYPEFFLTYAPIKDISGVLPVIDIENCKGITVFQHAIWAGDVRFMCNMMLDCLPKNADGEKLRIELLRQCNELMDKGVVYVVDGKVHREKQFSLQALIIALQSFVENFGNRSWDERDFHWCTDVGLPQNLLPAIARHHYSNPEESFLDKPNFREQKKLIRSIEIVNFAEGGKNQLWDDSLIGLGSKFAIAGRGARGATAAAVRGGWVGQALVDLAALTALCEVGTKIDLPALMQRLQSPIQSLNEDLESRVFDLS